MAKTSEEGREYPDDRRNAFRAYTNATRHICEIAQRELGVTIETAGWSSKERHGQAVRQLIDLLKKSDDVSKQRIREAVGVEIDEIEETDADEEDAIVQAVSPTSGDGVIRDIDDLTPNQVLCAMWVTAAVNAPEEDESYREISVPDFLRQTLQEIWQGEGLNGRINVGANRHWPRFWDYLLETEDALEQDGVRHFRVMNVGRGRVAQSPADPRRLRIRIGHATFE